MARFERHRASDPVKADDLAVIQDNVESTLQPLLTNPLIDGGVLVGPVAITTSATNVSHLLGRAVRGWVLVDKDADARVWRQGAATPLLLPLRASAAVNVRLYVF